MLVNAADMLKKAEAGHYALGAFNTNNLEWTLAVLQAAEEAKSPIIIQCSAGAAKWMGGLKVCADMVKACVESMGITGAGNHVAIPHGKSSAVLQNTIAIGRSNHMVEWESYDEEPVNLFFLFCVSDDKGFEQTHLRLLAQLAGKIGSEALVEKLQHAQTKADIISILTA